MCVLGGEGGGGGGGEIETRLRGRKWVKYPIMKRKFVSQRALKEEKQTVPIPCLVNYYMCTWGGLISEVGLKSSQVLT